MVTNNSFAKPSANSDVQLLRAFVGLLLSLQPKSSALYMSSGLFLMTKFSLVLRSDDKYGATNKGKVFCSLLSVTIGLGFEPAES